VELRDVLASDPRIAYALLFGSAARGTTHTESDLDVAIGLQSGVSLTPRDIGALVADLSSDRRDCDSRRARRRLWSIEPS
jgi:predicted nucleotidyltransferase